MLSPMKEVRGAKTPDIHKVQKLILASEGLSLQIWLNCLWFYLTSLVNQEQAWLTRIGFI
jgi:hypothetical protein